MFVNEEEKLFKQQQSAATHDVCSNTGGGILHTANIYLVY
jgi:hypothetical protein